MNPTIKALKIIAENEITSASQFARFMWPDSPAWKRHGRCGPNGVTQGTGIQLAGGAYLGKLRQRKLISQLYPARLTEAGKALIKQD